MNSTDNTFDPETQWDPYIDRFWVVAVSRNPNPSGAAGTRRSRLLIAVSNSDDAADGFSTFSLDAMADGSEINQNWCDYPQMGFNMNHLFISCNMFEFGGGFAYSKIRVLSKSQFLGGACCAWWDFWDMVDLFSNSFTIQPATMYGAGPGTPMVLVNAHGGGGSDNELSMWRITNAGACCGGGSGDPDLEGENYTVGSFDTPPNAEALGSTTNVDTGDSRILFATWRNNTLYFGGNTACNDGDDACLQYLELNVPSAGQDFGDEDNYSLTHHFAVGASGLNYYYPSVAANDAGNRSVVYSRSGPSEFIGTYYFGIPAGAAPCNPDSCPGNPTDGPEITLAPGVSGYTQNDTQGRNRWGDYFGSSPDPDGVGVWVTGEFAAAGGNWATQVGLTYELMDTTAPVTVNESFPAPTPFGWNNSNVLVVSQSSDGGSGVRRVTRSGSGAQPFPSTTFNTSLVLSALTVPGTTTLSLAAEDNWGNIENPASTITVRIDKTPPSFVCEDPDGAWHADNVTLSCSATDALSGIVPGSANFSLSTSVPPGEETANALTDSFEVCDKANNCVTAGPIGGNKIDRKAPEITLTTPPDGAQYLLNEPVAADYECSDGGSGVTGCVAPVANAAFIDTSSVGAKSFAVNAVDAVGNASSDLANYVVTFKVCLNYDATKQHKANSVVPINIALCDFADVNVSSPSTVVKAESVSPAGALQSPGNTNPGNVFYYSNSGYLYMLSTKGYSPGAYSLIFSATGDPVLHAAPFVLK